MTPEQALEIEKKTRLQSEEMMWYQQRRLRLTASNFGTVAKRRSTTPVANLVKSLLYSKPVNSKPIRWGKNHEVDAEMSYIAYLKQVYTDVSIQHSGLVINCNNPCLACSPDGIVHYVDMNNVVQTGLVEYKCPYSLAEEKKTPTQGCLNKTFFCSLNNDKVEIKKNHSYFYQVQGCLAVTGYKWCDFVVWTPEGISVERISFDFHFWKEVQPKLILFYNKAILPELAVPRHITKQPIREPFLSL